MLISKEGLNIISISGIIAETLILLYIFTINIILGIIAVVTSIFLLLTIYFFRDPERKPPKIDNVIISPADGTIVGIDEVYEKEYLKEKGRLVSIFLSIFDVHVNRVPISGIVEYIKYQKGDFYPAFSNKSSLKNENCAVGITNGKQKIFFRQIAGILARRIINNLKIGDKVKGGQRFGIIKFGSRVDIILPEYTEITVKLKQRVISGETIIGVFPGVRNAELQTQNKRS